MYNQVTAVGRMAADPESRFTQSGKQVVNFTVCTDVGWGDNKKTEFVRCVAWDKLAEIIAQYMNKGSVCMAVGEMQTRCWDDKDGNKRYNTEIIVRDFKMLGGKKEGGQQQEPQPPQQSVPSDDVPF